MALGLLLIAPAASAQSTPTDSQTLQALLQEIRQLRRDLHTTTAAAQRAQILLYRLQIQQAVVARAQQRLDEFRSKLADLQSKRKNLEAEIKLYEDFLNRVPNSTERKEIEDSLPKLKARLEPFSAEEQQLRTREIEADGQLRTEQAKLSVLQDELDRIEKMLEELSRPPEKRPE